MKALEVARRASVEARPLRWIERPEPAPGPGEVLIDVLACGVCRTDLHVVEGDLPPKRSPVVPGHQAVGVVAEAGPGVASLKRGDRVGAAWLYRSCGACRFCRDGRENLCDAPLFTGYDVDGGYAERMVARADFCYPLPADADPEALTPLLCAGIIGYRALKLSGAPKGGRLGLYGFGGSAHVAIQVARHWGCEVYAFSRAESHRRLAESLGAAWTGPAEAPPPKKLDAAILFAPSGALVPAALAALDKGATLAVAGIHMSAIPGLEYQEHLFQERRLVSVTANTREDGRELLALAAEIPIKTKTRPFPLSQANEALLALKSDRVDGAAVLRVG